MPSEPSDLEDDLYDLRVPFCEREEENPLFQLLKLVIVAIILYRIVVLCLWLAGWESDGFWAVHNLTRWHI